MPATHFRCQRGLIAFGVCLDYCSTRCMLPRTLRLISEQREWTGTPTTTQLLQGTRESFLKIVTNYAIDPDSRVFAVHGTRVHEKLDMRTGDNELGEERLYDLINSGQFDNYQADGTLSDTKTSGSYKVMKALGICEKRLSNNRKTLILNGRHDRLDWALQLNDYRMKIEACGFPVKRMQIEALVRDGGTYLARQRGITRNSYLITINRISDHWIKVYFTAKWEALKHALGTLEVPPKCRYRERWGGRKCEGYCDVATKCQAIDNGASLDDVIDVTV